MKQLKTLSLFWMTGFLFAQFNHTHAQNLVLNPSFENLTNCPVGISQFNLVINWDDTNLGADSCSTPDIYAPQNNSVFPPCGSIVGGANSPAALMGYQKSRTGLNHAGFIPYSLRPFGLGPMYREYVQGTLATPLIAGQQYCVKFFLSTANNSRFTTDDIGLYFSNSLLEKDHCSGNHPTASPGPFTNITPQLQYSGPPIADSVNWVPLEWTYVATGGERYLTIGNFKHDNNTTIVDFNLNPPTDITGLFSIQPYVYFFIDDVEVTPITCCPEINISSITNTSCNGAADGSATVTVTGGIGPYTYIWSSGGGNSATTNNRPAGTHIVTVTDSRNCVVTKAVTITQPSALNVTVLSNNTGCGTTASVTTAGGVPPYSYLWSNGSTVASIDNIPLGTYTVTVTDSKGCTKTGSVNVTQTSGFTLNISSGNPTCGLCDGSATVTPAGGTAPFTYLWSNGQTSSTATALCAGSYNVTVTESAGSGSNAFWAEDFTNGGAGWTLNQAGSGTNGSSANQWVINNNANNCTQCAAAGGGGNYLHITCTDGICALGGDAGSCVYTSGPFFLGINTDKFVSSPNISTLGRTGITLTFWYISGGDPGKDYGLVRLSNDGGNNWVDLPTQYQGVTTCTQASVSLPVAYENIPDLKIGFRWINDADDGDDIPFTIDDIVLSSATGSSACTASAIVNVSSANSPVVTLATKTDIACFGANNGAISINVSGGNPPYNFAWTGGATSQNVSNLNGGTYSVTVTDNANCAATLSVTLAEPTAAITSAATITDAGCGAQTGAIDQTVSGGIAPYVFSWSSGSTAEDLTGVQAGSYEVTITDNNNCVQTASYTVNAPGSFSVTLSADSASCSNSADGAIVTNIAGGVAPFLFNWSSGQTTQNLTGLPAGVYTVTVTDDNICSVSATTTVSVPSGMSFNASITEVLCEGGDEGGIKLNVFGGTSPYTALWSSGDSGFSLTDLSPGVYTATVIDGNGCNKDTTISLEAASTYSIEVESTNATCNAAASGTAEVSIVNGNGTSYTYLWNTGATDSLIENLAPGTYTVTVTDILSCVRSATATVGSDNGLEIDFTVTDASCPDTRDGMIATIISGGTEPYAYLWNTGANTATLGNIPAAIYWLTVTDTNNCAGTDTVVVHVDSSGIADCDTLMIYDVFSPNGDGVNDTWIIDGLESYPQNELQVFNRWGNVVFEQKPYQNNWNGISDKGEALPSATYYYILKLHNADETVHSGSLTLIR